MLAEPDVYRGRIMEVFSGDDLVILFDLGVESLYKRQRVRLDGVDTPNGIRMGQDTDAGKVRAYVMNKCRSNDLEFTVVSRRRNSWVGKLTILTTEGPLDLNAKLIEMGFAFANKTPT